MKIAASHINLLRAIYTLLLEGVEVTPEGLCKVLHGVIDFETLKYVYSNAFGYYSSITNRRLKGRINHLINDGLLELKDGDFISMTDECKKLLLRPLEKKDREIPVSKNIRVIRTEEE